MTIYPKALTRGMTIGITGPSGGVGPEFHPRLDIAIDHLRSRGFKVVEGENLRSEFKHVSGPKEKRADEFMRFWSDPTIDMIFPPWGGELLIEILPLLDFQTIKKYPKWILGYSDISTILLPITVFTDIATAHGSNLMDSLPTQTDLLTSKALDYLGTVPGGSFEQNSSEYWQKNWGDFRQTPNIPFHLTERTEWKILSENNGPVEFSGRLIGGCLDTLSHLTGTKFGNVPEFARRYQMEGTIIYLENCEQSPCSVARILWNFRLAGWFDNCSGIVLGRSSAPDVTDKNYLSYKEALEQSLGDLDIPVLYDVDIGHLPPQLTLINGALAQFKFENGRGNLKQKMI